MQRDPTSIVDSNIAQTVDDLLAVYNQEFSLDDRNQHNDAGDISAHAQFAEWDQTMVVEKLADLEKEGRLKATPQF